MLFDYLRVDWKRGEMDCRRRSSLARVIQSKGCTGIIYSFEAN